MPVATAGGMIDVRDLNVAQLLGPPRVKWRDIECVEVLANSLGYPTSVVLFLDNLLISKRPIFTISLCS